MCIISKDIGINKEKEVLMLNVNVWIGVKTLYAIAKNKYDCQRGNTKGIIDVKEQIWFIKIFEAVGLILSGH